MFKLIFDVTIKRSGVMMCIKRHKSIQYSVKKLPYDRFVKFPDYTKIIKKMGFNKIAARRMLFHNQYLFDVPMSDIQRVYEICMKWNVKLTSVERDAKIFTLRPDVVESTIMVLQEMGAEWIDDTHILNYRCFAYWKMSIFKIKMNIPKSVNVTENLLQYVGPIPVDAPPLQLLSEDLSVNTYRACFYEWYLAWRLNLSEEEKSQVHIQHNKALLKHRSVRWVKRQIELLHDDIGFTSKQIFTFTCLSTGSPENLENILATVKTFGGIDIKEYIKHKPHLHKMKFDNVVNVKKTLKTYGYTDRMMKLFPDILLKPHKEVIKNLDIIENTPELRVLKNNKRSLAMVVNMKTTLARLEYLRYHKIKNITILALTGYCEQFERIIKTGIDRTNAKEIGYSFEKILKYDYDEIIQGIKKHPYWRHVDIVSMNDTANYLLTLFSPEDIHDNIQLLLYSKKLIEKTLENLPELTEKSEKEKKISAKDILAICLYEIEREHHFSGDGIWREDRFTSGACVIPENVEADLSDASDSESTEADNKEETENVQINMWLTKMFQKKIRKI